MAEVAVVIKGREVEYSSMLNLVKSMDLSSNSLYGEIPVELTSLKLQTLNLSNNHLVGEIPSNIGDMRWLESLDMSKNQLSGPIPRSFSNLTFLSYLNLSYNSFTGAFRGILSFQPSMSQAEKTSIWDLNSYQPRPWL
ncbi:hypothetical protein FEM48_Zijuj03G0125600 [Ziziphus jujuba var. spinosa]|uniref:Uncharacterized protein n=1 Tax=Ziziphus jujuba var. spinosa TaxID=714518 RepID=A0A978VK69_ZIZJJ|nr:hypothetical protein FEM48_Zijuj04G0136200 [Ziziphus jujuba var. spinosa]KAH7537745.1 hypothetical protein FEM48_Zijuj03G0125600 [Ziziphus jujuba var. spinosa]